MTILVTFLAACRSVPARFLLFGAYASIAPMALAQRAPSNTASTAASFRDSTALSLTEVMQRAMDRHPMVEAARARVVSASGGLRTAKTLPNPVLTYWAENLRRPGLSASTSLDHESQAYAMLPLEPLFQRWPRIARADAEVRAADADVALAQQHVALDAARAFFRVANAQVAVDAADDVRQSLATLVTFNQARVREGAAPESDMIRTQLELDRVSANATLDRVELARARSQLTTYLARPADAMRAVSDAGLANMRSRDLRVDVNDAVVAMTTPSALPTLDELVGYARTARPDLVASRARAEAARAEVTAQRTLTVRQIGATFGTKRTLGVTSLIAGVSLPVPLFDQNRGDVQRASGERAAADQDYVWAEREAVAELEGTLEVARLLREQADQLRGSFLARAEDSRRIALAAYKEGAVSLLQVIDATRTLADARITYYRTLFAQRQSLLDLNAAAGVRPLDGPSPRLAPPSGARP